ncbi:MAG: PA14 domain-containing protein [Deltaproteobacteria bacterium]|nr:PA14 domain-containing protein [Deltaproteobacteria bacterium]
MSARPVQAEPALPGVARLLEAAARKRVPLAVAAEALASELRCTRCHAGNTTLEVPLAPPLADVGTRVSAAYLKAFLLSPKSLKPGTSMPDMLAGVANPQAVADDLVAYLLSRGGQLQTGDDWSDSFNRDDGEALFSKLGCVACHGSQAVAPDAGETFVPLGALARKTTLGQLAAFLQDPAAVRPGTRMPNFRLTDTESAALATYLLREQLPSSAAEAARLLKPGVRYEYYEGNVREGPPDWKSMTFVRRGFTDTFALPPKIRDTKIALRFDAVLNVKRAGTYTFFTDSNDGSELSVDKRLVVNNHGFHGSLEAHGKIELHPGLHAVTVLFWQDEGSKGLKVSWEGPGLTKQLIPAELLFAAGSAAMKPLGWQASRVDATQAQRGAAHFAQLGCASCHDKAQPNAKPWRALVPDRGCLSPSPSATAPNFNLSSVQRDALNTHVRTRPSKSPTDAKARGLQLLATHNCVACHERDGLGGPAASVQANFSQTVEVDLGEEGRLPPTLTGAGAKLRTQAIRRIVGHAELHVRPYMATRMPTFSEAFANTLSSTLAKADAGNAFTPKVAPHKTREEGRRLLGLSSDPARTGFGCVNCHAVAGHPGPGTPGPDLALATQRLNYAWFERWLAGPQAVRPNTRMPAFWGDEPLLPDVAGGSAVKQRAAIWAYLAQGATPLPEGLIVKNAARELKVGTEPIVYRTFGKQIGPRAIVVGNPELVHVAFDANVVRMAQAWRGRFWDPSGTWTGRAGSFLEPLGDHVLPFPVGPSFARLPEASAPWPQPKLDSRELGGRFLGYRLDEHRRPVFRYVLNDVTIAEAHRPLVSAQGFGLLRSFTFDKSPKDLTFLAGEGRHIEKQRAGRYIIDGRLTLAFTGPVASAARVRSAGHETQQLVLDLPANLRSLQVEMFWP